MRFDVQAGCIIRHVMLAPPSHSAPSWPSRTAPSRHDLCMCHTVHTQANRASGTQHYIRKSLLATDPCCFAWCCLQCFRRWPCPRSASRCFGGRRCVCTDTP